MTLSRHDSQSGFTLLEVMVALTITGFVLGGLFSLLGGSKQLAWRSEDSLLRAVNARAAINYALLENNYDEVEPILENDRYRVRVGEIEEAPERKTQATRLALQDYEIVNEERDEFISGTRWIRLEYEE